MAILLLDPADEHDLLERRVAKVKVKCDYPGIQQCFAIAGWTPDGMLCTHVTPGSTKSEMKDTFDHLKNLGGKHVRYWYVVGPFTDHFQTPTAIWKSVKDVKSTFDSKLGKNANARFILDASEERQCHTWGMKVRAEHRTWEGMVVFSYAPAMGANAKTFTRFPSAAFRPF